MFVEQDVFTIHSIRIAYLVIDKSDNELVQFIFLNGQLYTGISRQAFDGRQCLVKADLFLLLQRRGFDAQLNIFFDDLLPMTGHDASAEPRYY